MTLRFYHRSGVLPNGPLVAEARASGERQGEGLFPFVPGTVSCFPLDPNVAGPQHRAYVEHFNRVHLGRLEAVLGRQVTMIHRRALEPWSRDAFLHHASQGLRDLSLRAELFEEDGTRWDPDVSPPNFYPTVPLDIIRAPNS